MKAFTTYNTTTLDIICSGYVADDTAASDQFLDGEAVLVGVAANQETQKISVVNGVPTVVSK